MQLSVKFKPVEKSCARITDTLLSDKILDTHLICSARESKIDIADG